MTIDWQFEQIEDLREDEDLEGKLALGRNGKGELPKDFWESYSAMANTQGGYIFLGVKEEKNGQLTAVGMPNPKQFLKALWDGLNNPQKASVNLLSNRDVQILGAGEKRVILIKVPEAARSQRPVFVNGNPMTGTFRRNHEGDYRCTKETVNRMLAEQVEDTRDARLLEGFDFADFDQDSIKAYRTQFQNRQPNHPWNECEMRDFLWNIGAWGKDRKSGVTAPTLAGVLMFGKLRPILEALPHYIVDYQERPQAKTEKRWVDRLTTDGSWSGNLYDFYRQVIRKLNADLKVPFQLKDGERVEDTPVHVALREALVNTLIHADYSGRMSVLVVKRPDMFGFRNPGGLRIPLADAKRGGDSDCRNRNLQKMFQLLGAGEQAGSGIPKIYTGWSSQHWRQPEFIEKITADREETLLRLRMVSLLPDDAVDELGGIFGKPFYSLPGSHRVALVAAFIEESVTHARLVEMTTDHPHDFSKVLHELVEQEFLESYGTGRGKYYFLPGCHPVADEVLPGSSIVENELSDKLSDKGAEPADRATLEAIAEPVSSTQRSSREHVKAAIIELCSVAELSASQLSGFLNRKEPTVRQYVEELCRDELLRAKHKFKTHPGQKYRAS